MDLVILSKKGGMDNLFQGRCVGLPEGKAQEKF